MDAAPLVPTWAYIRAVLMTVSDWFFGASLSYVAIALFQSGHLGAGESNALGVILGVYVLNRAALFLRIMGRAQRLAEGDTSVVHMLRSEPGSLPQSALGQTTTDLSDRDLDTTPDQEKGQPQ